MPEKSDGLSIPFLSWFDKPIKGAIESVFSGINTYTEALDIFNKYRNNHFQRVKGQVEHIKILGMSEPVRLIDVYSPAMVSRTIHGRLYEQEWLSVEHPETTEFAPRRRPSNETVRGDAYIEKRNRVVILGAAGSGKTTLLRHLALAYCDRDVFKSTKLKKSKFPFFVSMLSYVKKSADITTLLEYISRELEEYTDTYAPHFVERIVQNGMAVLILDSLDEVPLSSREQVVDDIREFCQGYPECKVVISCRTADYREVFDEFYEVELARLTKRAIRGIIGGWFAEDLELKAQMLRHLKHDPGVESLCETPLLLSLLCIQFRHDLVLPKRKAELYRRCIDAFLREWDAGRGFRRDTEYAKLSDDRKERIFESVAGSFFSEDIRFTFPQQELIDLVGNCCELYEIPREEAVGVLREIESHHGIIERFSADSFMFSHPSFQEYFAARNLLATRSEMEAVRRHFLDQPWANVIEFIVAMHTDPSTILRLLSAKSDTSKTKNFPTMARRTRTLWLLYRCLAAGAAISNKVRKDLYTHIVDSHFHMAATFTNGGVFPVPVLMKDGVRHRYVYYKLRRTFHQALIPLRLLANEILLSPSEEYAKYAVERLKRIRLNGSYKEQLSNTSTLLCLAIPVAKSQPKEVRAALRRAKKTARGLFERMIEESLAVMDEEKLR